MHIVIEVKPFIKSLRDYALHNAPKGICYHRIAQGSSIERFSEVDYVPVPQGSEIPGHIHQNSNALVLILSGSGFVELGNERKPVEPLDVVNIPAGTYHSFQASDQDLTFLSVQYPPIGGDYFFSKRLPAFRRIIPYAAAGALAASVAFNAYLYHKNRNLETAFEDNVISRRIERNQYVQGIESGMAEYRKQLEAMLGRETAKESERTSPYPAI